MTETRQGELDKLIHKVQALIAKADSTQDQYPEEAAECRRLADAMMAKYRIEESMLAAAAPAGTGLTPVWSSWSVCALGNGFKDYYRQIAASIMYHVGARGVFRYVSVDGISMVVLEVVGYESDLRYGEMLLTSALLAFGQHLEPQVDPKLSEQVNAYRLRMAGMELRRLAVLIRGSEANTKGNRRALRMMVKAEAELRGDDPNIVLGQGNNMKTFRASYAEGFSTEIYSRLLRMRYVAGEESQALVLAGRKDAVDEAFYVKYPQYRPQPRTAAIGNGRDACSKCAKAKSGFCNEHRHLRPTAAKEASFNPRAYRAGGSAASTVDLGTKGRLT